MALSERAQSIYDQISGEGIKFGDLKKIAKEIKRDHELASELWVTGEYFPRMLATLIFDKKLLTQDFIDSIDKDIQSHNEEERDFLSDWLLANQLMKNKSTIALMLGWEDSPSRMQRRLFWYYQARLRWTGQTPPPNSEQLLDSIEQKLASEVPEVQWAMNFTAGQIGTFEPHLRARCIKIGETTGLYRDEIVAKNCTPNYLPEFIAIQAAKFDK